LLELRKLRNPKQSHAMDAPLPDDFDPYLGSKPMQRPGERNDEGQQNKGTPQNESDDESVLPPSLHGLIPRPLRKLLFTGSCCVGVALLYMIEVYDHGMMPGVGSSFARASEVQQLKGMTQDLYVLSLARAIRDLSTDNCTARSRAITEQIDQLQSKYKAIYGAFYPHTECKHL
jgi:hypothetical protein